MFKQGTVSSESLGNSAAIEDAQKEFLYFNDGGDFTVEYHPIKDLNSICAMNK